MGLRTSTFPPQDCQNFSHKPLDNGLSLGHIFQAAFEFSKQKGKLDKNSMADFVLYILGLIGAAEILIWATSRLLSPTRNLLQGLCSLLPVFKKIGIGLKKVLRDIWRA